MGAIHTPRTNRAHPTDGDSRPAPAASQRPVLAPSHASHRPGSRLTRHQRGFKQFARPVVPTPVAARVERAALGLLPRASHSADRSRTTHAEVGTGHRTRTWNYRSTHISVELQSGRSLNTCDLASHVRQQKRPTAEAPDSTMGADIVAPFLRERRCDRRRAGDRNRSQGLVRRSSD